MTERVRLALSRSLGAHARRLLDATGCADEPTSWSPPCEWVTLAGLPGRGPACITAEQVEALLRRRLPPKEVADRLGVTLQHVRLVIRQHPPHLRLRSTGRRSTMPNNFPAELTPERLRQLVVDDRRSLRSIRAEASVSKHALTSALQRDGIPSPPPGRAQGRETEAQEIVGRISVGGTIGYVVFTALFFGLPTGAIHLLIRAGFR